MPFHRRLDTEDAWAELSDGIITTRRPGRRIDGLSNAQERTSYAEFLALYPEYDQTRRDNYVPWCTGHSS